ncbi:hypothetical protein IE53DRAFT_371787 [Violaceomyces palustris]|uniref:Uncharacterized protein n=1 Tax=Violaceomyces palustris TaxID=1673888 RepID=A0ACD0NMS0_9BASI|nr:hypothetical protein IE53DRAFT_371787 [Violaceomyces palustris]
MEATQAPPDYSRERERDRMPLYSSNSYERHAHQPHHSSQHHYRSPPQYHHHPPPHHPRSGFLPHRSPPPIHTSTTTYASSAARHSPPSKPVGVGSTNVPISATRSEVKEERDGDVRPKSSSGPLGFDGPGARDRVSAASVGSPDGGSVEENPAPPSSSMPNPSSNSERSKPKISPRVPVTPATPSQVSTSAAAATPGSAALTAAGAKRKRTRRACKRCRAQKLKCDGEFPCSRCTKLKVACREPSEDDKLPVASPATRTAAPSSSSSGVAGALPSALPSKAVASGMTTVAGHPKTNSTALYSSTAPLANNRRMSDVGEVASSAGAVNPSNKLKVRHSMPQTSAVQPLHSQQPHHGGQGASYRPNSLRPDAMERIAWLETTVLRLVDKVEGPSSATSAMGGPPFAPYHYSDKQVPIDASIPLQAQVSKESSHRSSVGSINKRKRSEVDHRDYSSGSEIDELDEGRAADDDVSMEHPESLGYENGLRALPAMAGRSPESAARIPPRKRRAGRGSICPAEKGIVAGQRIDYLLDFFDRHVYEHLPIFDPSLLSFNYLQSHPTLFSVILAIASKFESIYDADHQVPRPISEAEAEELVELAEYNISTTLIKKRAEVEDVLAVAIFQAWCSSLTGSEDGSAGPDPWLLSGHATRLAGQLGVDGRLSPESPREMNFASYQLRRLWPYVCSVEMIPSPSNNLTLLPSSAVESLLSVSRKLQASSKSRPYETLADDFLAAQAEIAIVATSLLDWIKEASETPQLNGHSVYAQFFRLVRELESIQSMWDERDSKIGGAGSVRARTASIKRWVVRLSLAMFSLRLSESCVQQASTGGKISFQIEDGNGTESSGNRAEGADGRIATPPRPTSAPADGAEGNRPVKDNHPIYRREARLATREIIGLVASFPRLESPFVPDCILASILQALICYLSLMDTAAEDKDSESRQEEERFLSTSLRALYYAEGRKAENSFAHMLRKKAESAIVRYGIRLSDLEFVDPTAATGRNGHGGGASSNGLGYPSAGIDPDSAWKSNDCLLLLLGERVAPFFTSTRPQYTHGPQGKEGTWDSRSQ